MKCPNCNKEINDSFKFCPYCATPIVANKCPHCGSTNLPPDSKFCPDCGGKIESVEEFKYQTFNVNGVAFKMIHVEGGTFTMGATPEMTDPYEDEKPAHQVTLSSYSIGETPVTQELWEAVMGSNPSVFEGHNLPVERVDWHECQEFIMKLNQNTGKQFRLPTEAEWEFAARGGNKSKHYQYSGSNTLEEVAWYDENSENETHPVKTKNANELGIYDMSGNVWEWCQDSFSIYSNNTQINPTGPERGLLHMHRGGCWRTKVRNCRLSCRRSEQLKDFGYGVGLRLALSE